MKRVSCLLVVGAAAVLSGVLGAASCGGDDGTYADIGTPDVDWGPDVGKPDVGTPDVGPPDARAPGLDAGPLDATAAKPDAAVPDAATPDGAMPDASPGKDASIKGDVGVWTPPPRTAACAAPTTAGGDTVILVATAIPATALAWNGTTAGMVFNDFLDIKFQRFTSAGRFQGMTVGLGACTGAALPNLAVGDAGGGAFVACWDQAVAPNTLQCTSIDSTGFPNSAFAAAGALPVMATGPGGLVLVYATATQLVAQKLDGAGKPVGASVKIGSAATIATALTPTPSGYAVAADVGGKTLKLYRLKPDLSANGAAVTIPGWSTNRVGIAAAGEKLALIWAGDTVSGKPQVSSVFVDAANVVGAKQKVDKASASSAYGRVDAAGGVDSFALAWSAFEGNIDYRALDGTGAPQGSAVDVVPSGWDDNPLSIVPVTDGFLVAVGVGITYSVVMMHLGCP